MTYYIRHILIILILISSQAKASHLFGGELTYQHTGGLNYDIILTLYGDCGGQSYNLLFSAIPRVEVYDGNIAFTSLYLLPFGTAGEEVTPVCPAEVNNTRCKGGSLPGVSRFMFKAPITLSNPSPNWTFSFDGQLGQNSMAGRSASITNISNGVGNFSIMRLVATLNNSLQANTSATYSTIPTPFYCINIPQQYNQGAFDINGDDLEFELTTALDANNGFVSYLNSYSYDFPLGTSPAMFSFNSSTGQMNFTPNIIQNSLVVTKVIERKNGIIVGTSMREMTFVVLNNCNNQSPSGSIFSTNGATLASPTTVKICNGTGNFSFSINATDPDGDSLTAIVSGLPAFANATITNNGSTSVFITISCVLPPGNTQNITFFVTYQDSGCPLSSKQTLAYTIQVEQPISATMLGISESCHTGNDGTITVQASSTNPGPLQYQLNTNPYQNLATFTGLSAGVYTITIQDANACTYTDSILINAPISPVLSILSVDSISCFQASDAILQVSATPADTSYLYTILPNTLVNKNGRFEGLSEGNYTVIVSNDKACSDTITLTLLSPPELTFGQVAIQDLNCGKINGKINAKVNIEGALYILNPGLFANKWGIFDNLKAGVYTITAQTNSECKLDTTVNVGVTPLDFFLQVTQQDLGCFGKGSEGQATVNTIGGQAPFSYLWSSSPPQTTPLATSLSYGYYTISVTDATGCEAKDTIFIQPGTCCEQVYIPNAFTPNGDGLNDQWRITTSAGMKINTFVIYNRYGQKVWQSYTQWDAWDGTFANYPSESGTYFYLLQYQCLSDQKQYTFKGDINLIR